MSRSRIFARNLGRAITAGTISSSGSISGGGASLSMYDSDGLLPASATDGSMAFSRSTDKFYIFDSSDWAFTTLDNTYTTAQLIAGGFSSGTYNINGVNTYFNSVTGYALYSSFGTSGGYTAVSYPAYNGNEIKYSQLSTYGYTLVSNDTLNYDDGTNSSGFATYNAKDGYLAFYASGNYTATFDLATWKGPADVTSLRVVWGKGNATATVNGNTSLTINNTVIRATWTGEHTDTSSFDDQGSTPLLRVYETTGSIGGISQIWFKNG